MALATHRLIQNCIQKNVLLSVKYQVVREQKFKDPKVAHTRLAHKGEC